MYTLLHPVACCERVSCQNPLARQQGLLRFAGQLMRMPCRSWAQTGL